ncbi:hypothetical protein ACFX1X_038797 [Malus domestica]
MAKIIAILMILLVAGSAMGDGDDRPKVPYCPIVLDNLTPCLPYVLENEAKPAKGHCALLSGHYEPVDPMHLPPAAGVAKPPPASCNGVQYLTKYSNGREDRRAICGCIKGAANMMGSIDFSLISDLPSKCGGLKIEEGEFGDV